MARILGYIACSLDGFIATPEGSLEWLFRSGPSSADLGEYDYNVFLKRIRTVVMGRGTYDFFEDTGTAWPYEGKRVFIVTSHPIPNPVGAFEIRTDVDATIGELRALDDGDVWMLGGGKLQMAFMARGALDELEIYVVPEIIGGGFPLFPATGHKARPKLISSQVIPPGTVRMHYRFD
jgi:dihydrofolate reductase